jgi:hypothetical protein
MGVFPMSAMTVGGVNEEVVFEQNNMILWMG